jgi:hypothetical protein
MRLATFPVDNPWHDDPPIVMRHTNIDSRSWNERLRDEERAAGREAGREPEQLTFEFSNADAQSHRAVRKPGDGQGD